MNIYRPPEGNKNTFIDLLEQMLSKFDGLDRYDIILTGDFNIDVLEGSATKDRLYMTMADFGLRQLINEPTRNKSSKTCIDLIFTNIDNVQSSGVAILNASDHLPVYMTTGSTRPEKIQKHFVGRFCSMFMDLSWNEFDQCQDVEMCWNIFSNSIDKILNILCPIKDFKIKFREEPWLTPELIAQIIEKKQCAKKGQKI